MVTRWGGRQTYRPTIWHRDGKREELEWAKLTADAYAHVGFSPDGQALAVLGGVPGGIDAWTLDLSRRRPCRVRPLLRT